MSNATAVARERATTPPNPAKAAPTRREPDPSPQWLELGLQHTRRLCDLLYTLTDAETKAQGLIQELVESAEAHLHNLVSDESWTDLTVESALYCQISTVVVMLEAAWYAAEHGPLDYPPDLHAAVIPSAIKYAKDIAHALQEAPLTNRFQAMAQPRTVAGARPHRDRPQPPIRRLDDAHTPEQLRTILEFVAGAAHTQSNILMMARTTEQWECSNLIDAAQAMARQIGAAADLAIGGEVLGSMSRWNYGPLFDAMGKAGAA